jgi:hypothetical protein
MADFAERSLGCTFQPKRMRYEKRKQTILFSISQMLDPFSLFARAHRSPQKLTRVFQTMRQEADILKTNI